MSRPGNHGDMTRYLYLKLQKSESTKPLIGYWRFAWGKVGMHLVPQTDGELLTNGIKNQNPTLNNTLSGI
eukprot:12392062-Karenia_brevis.AAC.1